MKYLFLIILLIGCNYDPSERNSPKFAIGDLVTFSGGIWQNCGPATLIGYNYYQERYELRLNTQKRFCRGFETPAEYGKNLKKIGVSNE